MLCFSELELVKRERSLSLKLLQSSPQILGKQEPIKGSGENSISCIIDLAKKNQCQDLDLLSTNDSFYEYLGFEKDMALKEGVSFMFLDEDKFDPLVQKINRKYRIANNEWRV